MSRAALDAAMLRAAGPLAPFQRWAAWTASLTGWRRFGYAMLMGAIAACAMPPIDLTPLLLVSFMSLVWLADAGGRRGDAFLLGWSFGFGFFLAGLYWVGAALFVDIASFWWMLPFAVLAFPAGLAIFAGLALLAANEARRRFSLRGTPRILALAVAWCVLEWLRGHVLSGFPWILMGYGWSGAFPGSDAMLQITALVGIYGLSLITVTAAALPARLGDYDRGRGWAPLAAIALIAVPMAGGAIRLWLATPAMVPDVVIRLVQPSIPEILKNDPASELDNYRRLIALSASPTKVPIAAVVWPEASAPPFLERDEALRRDIALAMPKAALLIAGDVRTDPAPAAPRHVWNGLVALGPDGSVIAAYDKFHLVPFGEYMPLQNILPIPRIVPGTVDFSAGDGPKSIALPGLPDAGPLICYEAIFPGDIVDPGHRPGWLVNVTNDAWYGVTSGPFQHLAMARVRAVEEGLPLLRAANNGITAAIDPYGRVLSRLGLDEIGVLDTPLPRALAPTFYSRIDDIGFLAILGLQIIIIIAIAARTRRN
jgi:apolipoprotein N-acyltransferase